MFDYAGLQLIIQTLALLVSFAYSFGSSFTNGMNREAIESSTDHLREFSGTLSLIFGVGGWVTYITYFSICEWRWGKTLGKRLFGLRVANHVGEKPRYWQAFLRAFALPGAFGVTLVNSIATYVFMDMAAMMSMGGMVYTWVMSAMPIVLPGLVSFLVFKRRSPNMGIQDLISQTRVIELRTEKKARLKCIGDIKFESLPANAPQHIGRFDIKGVLASESRIDTYLGVDNLLSRRVIICTQPLSEKAADDKFHMNRASRSRWLQGGETDGQRWDAYEYSSGVPFSFITNRQPDVTWDDIKLAIFDIVGELQVAIHEKSVPKGISCDHFLIRPDGHGVLMDVPINITGKFVGRRSNNNELGHSSILVQTQDAFGFLRDVLEWCLNLKFLPQCATDLINDFRRRPEDIGTLNWLHDQLNRECSRQSNMAWDSRIGALSLTIGAEWTAMTLLTVPVIWWSMRMAGFFPAWKWMWAITVSAFIPFVIGILFRGGPVFHFLGVEVRNMQGKLASGWRAGLRNMLAWLPFALASSSFPLLMEINSEMFHNSQKIVLRSESETKQSNNTEIVSSEDINKPKPFDPTKNVAILDEVKENPMQTLAMLSGFFIGNIVFALGAIFSIWSPARGVQDYLAGTRLNP
ncbi:MAG: RDD family protein [Pirellulaceae bacterium]